MNTLGLDRILARILLLIPAAALLTAPADAAKKLRFEFTPIAVPGTNVFPFGINNHGVVIGSMGLSWSHRPFKYYNGVLQSLPLPKGDGLAVNDAGDVLVRVYASDFDFDSHFLIRAGVPVALPYDFYAYGLNNLGVISGRTSDVFSGGSGYKGYAATWSNGVIRPLGVPYQDWSSVAAAINDSGVTVGSLYRSSTSVSAVMFGDGQNIPLPAVPGYDFGHAHGINNRGDVLCTLTDSGYTQRAFLFREGSMIDLGTLPGGAHVNASTLNNRGHVVGSARDARMEPHAFLYRNGVMHDLTDFIRPRAGITAAFAFAINDEGQIVGCAQYEHGLYRGFLLTPKTLMPNALHDMIQSVRAGNISRTLRIRLLAWLKAAENAFDRGRIDACVARLQAFKRQVVEPCHQREYIPGRLGMIRKPCIPPALKQHLVKSVQAIIDSLEE